MPNRTAKFVSALFASVLAGVPLTAVSNSAAVAGDDCLSAPKAEAPNGSHWYYRVEHPSNRHCWYLRSAGEKASQIATRPAPPKAEPTVQRSIAEARAELPPPQMRVETETDLTARPPTASMPPNPVIPEKNLRANIGGAGAPSSAVASRWPEPSGVVSSANPTPATGNPGTNMAATLLAAQPPAAATIPLAAADYSSGKTPRSTLMLLIAMVGALSFAGLMGRAMLRFRRIRPVERPPVRNNRRAIWDSIVIDPPLPSPAANADARMPGVRLPRDPRAADDPNRRVTEMLARLARSAAT